MNDLPPGWIASTLGDVTDISSGFGFPKDRQGRNEGKYPFAKVSDISRAVREQAGVLCTATNFIDDDDLASLGAKPVGPGSVVFAKIGEALRLNRRAITVARVVLDNNCMALTPHPEVIISEYLFLFMQTVDLSPLAVATAVPSIRRTDVSAIKLPLPPLAEQRRIVAKLDQVMERTARARAELARIPALIELHRQALLRAAFNGLLTEEWRAGRKLECAAKLVSRIGAPAQPRGGREATDSVICGQGALSVSHPETEPPKGWQWTPLLRIARQETGHTPSRSHDEYWNGGIPWIGIRDAGAFHGRTITDTTQTISQAGLENSSARLLPAGTVCLSRTASVGYVTIMGREMATSQDFATWTCTEALEPKFLMYALLAEGDDIRAFGKGSTHTTIYFPEIRALHICLAPLEEQREIVRRIESAFAWLDKVAHEHAQATRLLDHLDQALLTKAFRGELVPQDPADEPAATLLARIRAEREGAAPPARKRKART